VVSGDYTGEHWLASFAVYLLTARPVDLAGPVCTHSVGAARDRIAAERRAVDA
jgi:hypothetical protein